MAFAELASRPKRRERHFEDRIVWCFAERTRTVYECFSRAAATHAQSSALVFGDETWTYARLEREAASWSAVLARRGVRAGDRVALQVRNRPGFVLAFLAIQRLAAIAVPIDPRLPGPEVGHVLADSGSRLYLHDADLAGHVPHAREAMAGLEAPTVEDMARHAQGVAEAEAAAPADPPEGEEAVAAILYTSGTTGKPKGAALTHLNFSHSIAHHAGNLGLTPRDRSLIAVPLAHITGLLCGILAPLATGGTLVLLPRFNAREFVSEAQRTRMSYTIMVPAMYNLCLRLEDFESFDLSSWRLGHFGGAPMPAATIEALARRLPGLRLVNGYGATEVCSPAAMWPVGADVPPDCVGLPMPCAEIAIMDPERGVEMPCGQPGEIWVRGPMVAKAYWGDPAATAAAFAGGFWRSGDVGRVDAQGCLYVLDRIKDLINRGGYKIYSAEVEAALLACPGVREAAVVARADPVLGERVHAFVSVTGELDASRIAGHCGARLADYKVPETWSLSTDLLPRTASGKIDKKTLREQAAAPAA